jgi:glycosidase
MTPVARAAPLVVTLALLVAALPVHAIAPPSVSKVDPPSWWARHSLKPVRLLVRGANLAEARAHSTRADIHPGLVTVSERGTYAFVDVTIDPTARAGPAALRLTTASGAADVPFEIVASLPRAGRFQGFGQDDAIYLVMPDRFANGDPSNDRPARSAALLDRTKARFYHGGDLQGLIDRLPYLADLGVTTIWLNPVYDNADSFDPTRRYDGEPFTDYHGYGAIDFYAVDEHLGDVASFARLVDAAHARGLKIMQDQVANHTGPMHPWADDPPTPAWFHGTVARHPSISFNAPLLIDPRTSVDLRRAVLDGWFAGILPDLNQDDPEVARYLIQNSLWWVGMTGLDAIRQDTVPYVPATFWHAWTAALVREYPRLWILGEVMEDAPPVVAAFQRDMHSLFDYPLYRAVRQAFARGGSLRDITAVLAQDAAYPHPDRLVPLLGSHDVRRFMGEAGATPAALKLAATFIITTRGIPQWYYGDEIAMTGGDDPDNRRDFPGGWPDDPRNAFDVSGRSADEQDVFTHVRTLLHLRRKLEALRRGSLRHLALSDSLYAYARESPGGFVIVAINKGDLPAEVDVSAGPLRLRDGISLDDMLPGQGAGAHVRGDRLYLTVPARSSAVFQSAPR